ncbi:peptide-methionine (S)-S-oxide reductase MsrA [Kangiella sediminilitoris]|uniref:Peptide methionine sulfoxide reductase MsrA n=1 Tax=Kangiella sediminilitoris TaxID=1144748 RepID=A0A1B3BDD6_9GAMM|nr:peptide-methionine (S)-S-oxide reductase MsrA [Kangiella sediminilitoris]AOE50697.1 Peptide methionine sulfoxide reductase MsrA [Kangiella sediminilitoris]
MRQAILGGGCFWCIEAVMQRLKGVHSVVSGYAGGDSTNPTYREVCSGESGHAEVVKVTFDDNLVTYKDLLEVFFTTHDPTQVDGQGADIGTQYRSIIMYSDEEQRKVAEAVINDVGKLYEKRLATELVPVEHFYPAEDYHQDYYEHNGMQPYCMAVIEPKLQKLRQKHSDKLK